MHVAILIIFTYVLFTPQSTLLDYVLNITTFSTLISQELVNVPAWSMGFEFYIPIILVAFVPWRSLDRRTVVIWTVGLMALYAWICFNQAAFGDSELIKTFERHMRAIVGLVLGFFLWCFFGSQERYPMTRGHNAIVLGLSVGFFALVLLSALYPGFGILFPVLFAMLMYFGMRSRSLLSAPVFQFIGKLSFGIYMVHVPLLLLYAKIFGEEMLEGNVPIKASMLVVAVLLAVALHYAVELPGIRLGRNLLKYISSMARWTMTCARASRARARSISRGRIL